MNKFKRLTLLEIVVWLMVMVFAVVYAFMSVQKHNSFQTFGWDLGVFDQGIWQWAGFKIPYSSFHNLPWLADHFHLILVTLAPFYWIWSDVRVLLIAQAVLVSFGALPLYYLSKRVTKNIYFTFVIILGYLLFYSLQSFIFSDFHELAFLPVTLGGLMLFWELKKTKLYWIFFVLALLVKEEIGLLLAAFGLWGFIHDRKRYKQAIFSIILGLGFTFSLILFIMPLIGGKPYLHLNYGQSGQTLTDVVITVLKNPFYIITSFTDSDIKLSTLWTTFWPWGFLPLFFPSGLLLIFEQFASRFLDYGKPIRWTMLFAYSLPMATIMAWGSIYGFNNLAHALNKVLKISKNTLGLVIPFILLILIIGSDLLLHGPINTIFKKQFYLREEWMNDNLKAIKCIPNDVSVSAQNSLTPWVSQREHIEVFPHGIGLDYIILDLHAGQSENSFSFLGSENTKVVMSNLIEKDYYEYFCRFNSAAVLKRKINPLYDLKYPFKIIYDGV